MKDLRLVIKLMMAEKKDVLLSILFGYLAGTAAVALFANSGYLISKAAVNPPLYILTVSIALLKLFSFTRALSKYGERFYSHRATFTKLSNLRVHFFEKLEPLAPRIFNRYRSGDLLSRIVGDVESLQNFFLRVYYPPIVMVIVFLSTIVFTSFFSVPIALILVFGLILTGFVVPLWFAMKQRGIQHQLREVRGALSTEVTEYHYGFRDLKLHQKLDSQEEQLLKASQSYVNEQEKYGLQAIYSQSINQTLSLMISWLILTIGALFVVEGQLDGVFLAMLVMISLTVFENSTPMASFPNHFEDSRRAAGRLFSVVDQKENESTLSPGNADNEDGELGALNVDQAWSLEVKNLSFGFPDEPRLALKNVSLKIPAGTKTAIVGPSGSGKSTLLYLLLKAYPEFRGDIILNGKSTHQLKAENIWEGTNVVLQSNHFFYGTIRENLLLASDDLSDGQLKKALEAVKLEDFSLDDPVLEKGENLSGGEKQRLAIARAMLKASHLWLLDEPTSSVDSLTEQFIYDQLFMEDEDTFVLISHRLKGLEKMDQIIVMENGGIVETGTFDELMRKRGYFYEMKQIEASIL
ncbi:MULTISPECIES: thiol reductant ABC exporter subunit CydC [Bacillaceae]|uniref:Thiol reductant ABC exporter subunit CydC n=1 Tax=Evansella alkalicola TaxID=745819 RepID=A0ABS6JP76_9BACI|nr:MULTISPECIES: thiol reductant ABC exporter subunit CydC [Bacillaceae]MBU9720368.1 thiol reductant ABC exporter subunit CydC [Bacillus alkalicola]